LSNVTATIVGTTFMDVGGECDEQVHGVTIGFSSNNRVDAFVGEDEAAVATWQNANFGNTFSGSSGGGDVAQVTASTGSVLP